MTCLSFTELSTANVDLVHREHLSTCLRCRAIARRVTRSDIEVAEEVVAPTRGRTNNHPDAGEIWTFWSPAMEEYVVGAVLEAQRTECIVVPVLHETVWAADADLSLSSDLVGYPALAPLWAGGRLLPEQAVDELAAFPEDELQRLTAAHEAFRSGERIDDPAGPPILHERDPRLGAHVAITDEMRRLYEPRAMLSVADQLGPVLAHRREALGISIDAWRAELDLDSPLWAAFEAGEADPYASIPVNFLARAIDRLGLLASRRLIELARAAVLANHVPEQLSDGPALARRRRGFVSRRRPDAAAARDAADRYTDALAKELGM